VNVFATLISQVAKRSKAQHNQLFVKRIQLAQGWNVGNRATKHLNVSFKRTLSGDHFSDPVSGLRIANIYLVEPTANGL
jgi:hypothetical protein